jgi:hypothetical protein
LPYYDPCSCPSTVLAVALLYPSCPYLLRSTREKKKKEERRRRRKMSKRMYIERLPRFSVAPIYSLNKACKIPLQV